MPELPEVETTRRGIAPHIEGRRVTAVTVRNAVLREPVPPGLGSTLASRRLAHVGRRAKYLSLNFDHGALIIHLGMSGSLRIAHPAEPPGTHDHVDIDFDGVCLRYRDPRRFGLLRWQPLDDGEESILDRQGIEPLAAEFTGRWLFDASRGRKTPIKLFLMDGRRLAGVGNIYASESLYAARIDPRTPAGTLGLRRCERLAEAVKQTLERAIEAGGSTLRDFTGGDGRPGYFQQSHSVYGRAGLACPRCASRVVRIIMGQRSTFLCPRCQRR